MNEQPTSNEEVAERIAKLRAIHKKIERNDLSHEERVRLENEAVPGIGDLHRGWHDEFKKKKGRSK